VKEEIAELFAMLSNGNAFEATVDVLYNRRLASYAAKVSWEATGAARERKRKCERNRRAKATRTPPGSLYEASGRFATITRWSEITGIKRETIKARVRNRRGPLLNT
jgi:hypothetical protein